MFYIPTLHGIYCTCSNCNFPDNISTSLYLHSFRLWKEKLNLNLVISSASVCNFLCCSKPPVTENVVPGCIIFVFSCPYHCALLKKEWKKLLITFKKFVFLFPKDCSLHSSFSFFFFPIMVNKTSNFCNNFILDLTYCGALRI